MSFSPILRRGLAGPLVAVALWAAADAAPPAADAAAKTRLDALGAAATAVADDAGRLTEIEVRDGAGLTAEDVALFGTLGELRKLRILNCRLLDDTWVATLTGLGKLDTLAVTNSAVTDAAVETIAGAFPGLVDLDLSSNTNVSGSAFKWIARLPRLERLALLQNRFNDLHTRRLVKLQDLEVLDLRGNMEAGDMTLDVIGRLPKIRALKHRSTAVTDDGIARLAASGSLESLLIQDFAITSAAGPALARIRTLTSLEVFRCQGFGSEGLLALAGLPLARLTLRDLPNVGDEGLAVLDRLPELKRLSLQELASVGDEGLRHLAASRKLAVLDIWNLPRMTDATIAVIAGLPALEELSIRSTGVTDAGLAKLADAAALESLTLKDNGPLSAETRARFAARKLKKLDLDPPPTADK